MFFNGARAFVMAYWIAMHLRQLFKPPRLKQLPWSYKKPIEYGSSTTVHYHYTSWHHNDEFVKDLVRCHATAMRFLLTLFEVLRRRVLVVMVAVVTATDRSCGGNGAALMARITIDLEYFRLTIEWPTQLCEDVCGCCGGGAVMVFVFQLNNIRDKCWGLVDYNMSRGKVTVCWKSL